jgi:hypothetical protein
MTPEQARDQRELKQHIEEVLRDRRAALDEAAMGKVRPSWLSGDDSAERAAYRQLVRSGVEWQSRGLEMMPEDEARSAAIRKRSDHWMRAMLIHGTPNPVRHAAMRLARRRREVARPLKIFRDLSR